MKKNKVCIICKKELNHKTVYGGFMGLLYRLFFRSKDWQKFDTCQSCRDMVGFGWSTTDILQIRGNKHEKRLGR